MRKVLLPVILLGIWLLTYGHNRLAAQGCLEADFRLNGNAADSSGNGFHGTISGVTTATDRFGVANGAYSFDGINDYIDAGTTLGNFGSSDFTIDFWMKTSSLQTMRIIGKRVTCLHSNFWNLGIKNGKIEMALDQNSSGTIYQVLRGVTNLADSAWHHIIFVRDAGVLTFYVDGLLESTISYTFTVNLSNTGDFRLGYEVCVPAGFTSSYDGLLDDVKIYDCVHLETMYQATSKSYAICHGESINVNGNSYDTTGIYVDTISSTTSLTDTVQTTSLYVHQVNAQASLIGSDTLVASPSNATYQWWDCTSGIPISGATNQSFIPIFTGNYAVIVTDSSCSDTSTCLSVVIPTTYVQRTVNYDLCQGESIAVGGSLYTQTGTYIDTLTGTLNTDTIQTSVVYVHQVNTGTIVTGTHTINAILNNASYQWLDCGTGAIIPGATLPSFTPVASGSYAVIVDDGECADTSHCVPVVVPPTYQYITIHYTACSGDTVVVGQSMYTETGTYTDTLSGAGVDTIQTSLITFNVVDTGHIVSGDTLVATASNASFQWIECNIGPITGEINRHFVPTANGHYQVEVTQNGCVDTSDCIEVKGVGVEQFTSDHIRLKLWPNPTNNYLHLTSSELWTSIRIANSLGAQFDVPINGSVLDIRQLSPGLYFVQIEFEQGLFVTKPWIKTN